MSKYKQTNKHTYHTIPYRTVPYHTIPYIQTYIHVYIYIYTIVSIWFYMSLFGSLNYVWLAWHDRRTDPRLVRSHAIFTGAGASLFLAISCASAASATCGMATYSTRENEKKKTNYRTSTERETKRLFGSFCLDKMRNQTYLLHFITGPGSLKSIESMEIFHEAFGSVPSQTTRSGPDVSIGLVRTNRVSIQQDQLRALASACLSAFESKLWQLWQSHFGSFGSFGCKVSDDFAIFAINDTTWCKRLQRWSRDLLRC